MPILDAQQSAAPDCQARSEENQRKFEFMCKRQQEAATLHDGSGHRNPTSLVHDLKKTGIPLKHLQRYIHAHRCKYCDANLGRAAYQCQTAKQNGGGLHHCGPITPRTTIKKTLADKDEITSAPPPDTALRPFKTVLKQGPMQSTLHK